MDWPRIRRRIKERDGGRCQWPTERGVCGSTDRVQVDRRLPFCEGGSAADENLWTLCHTHHGRKSSAEGRRAQVPRAGRRRAPEQHPGRRTP